MADIVITWTPFALRSLDEIYYFIFNEAQSPAPAEKFVEKIFNRTNQLISFPDQGNQNYFLKRKGLTPVTCSKELQNCL